jgi:hypothetical protein
VSRKTLLSAVVISIITVFIVAALAVAASSQTTYTLGFDHSQGVFGPPGTFVDLGTIPVDPADRDKDCIASVEVTNESIWADTNLYLGDAVATDVESAKGTYAIPMGHLVPGESAEARLHFGPGGASSIEGTFTLDCAETPPVITQPPSEPPVVTTPPPIAAPPVSVPARFTG